MMNNKHFRNDLILIGVLLATALIIFLIFKSNLKVGNKAVVTVDGKTVCSLDLSENISETVKTQNGENTIEVKDGKVSVTNADCPDKICANHRAISKTGETIVCLPHKLVVEITEKG